jgi:HSP90 family molecular chaperone
VGFYSAFLVAQTVTVITKNNNDDTTWQWQADQGSDGFTVKEADGARDLLLEPLNISLSRNTGARLSRGFTV